MIVHLYNGLLWKEYVSLPVQNAREYKIAPAYS
jgi:hypothetical protein